MAVGGVAASIASGKSFHLGSRIPQYREPQLDQASQTGKLSIAEMTTIIALAEVLIPNSMNSERVSGELRSYVDERTLGENGYLKEYRRAAALLDKTADSVKAGEGKFADLQVAQRQRVLEKILWQYRADQTRMRQFEAIFAPTETLAFRKFVVKDILRAFFSRLPAEAWAIVGYSHYPGVPGDPRAYTRPLSIRSSSNFRDHAA